MRYLASLVLFAAACGDNQKSVAPADAGADASMQALAPCVERPTTLARSPAGHLPCELLPPGFVAR